MAVVNARCSRLGNSASTGSWPTSSRLPPASHAYTEGEAGRGVRVHAELIDEMYAEHA